MQGSEAPEWARNSEEQALLRQALAWCAQLLRLDAPETELSDGAAWQDAWLLGRVVDALQALRRGQQPATPPPRPAGGRPFRQKIEDYTRFSQLCKDLGVHADLLPPLADVVDCLPGSAAAVAACVWAVADKSAAAGLPVPAFHSADARGSARRSIPREASARRAERFTGSGSPPKRPSMLLATPRALVGKDGKPLPVAGLGNGSGGGATAELRGSREGSAGGSRPQGWPLLPPEGGGMGSARSSQELPDGSRPHWLLGPAGSGGLGSARHSQELPGGDGNRPHGWPLLLEGGSKPGSARTSQELPHGWPLLPEGGASKPGSAAGGSKPGSAVGGSKPGSAAGASKPGSTRLSMELPAHRLAEEEEEEEEQGHAGMGNGGGAPGRLDSTIAALERAAAEAPGGGFGGKPGRRSRPVLPPLDVQAAAAQAAADAAGEEEQGGEEGEEGGTHGGHAGAADGGTPRAGISPSPLSSPSASTLYSPSQPSSSQLSSPEAATAHRLTPGRLQQAAQANPLWSQSPQGHPPAGARPSLGLLAALPGNEENDGQPGGGVISPRHDTYLPESAAAGRRRSVERADGQPERSQLPEMGSPVEGAAAGPGQGAAGRVQEEAADDQLAGSGAGGAGGTLLSLGSGHVAGLREGYERQGQAEEADEPWVALSGHSASSGYGGDVLESLLCPPERKPAHTRLLGALMHTAAPARAAPAAAVGGLHEEEEEEAQHQPWQEDGQSEEAEEQPGRANGPPTPPVPPLAALPALSEPASQSALSARPKSSRKNGESGASTASTLRRLALVSLGAVAGAAAAIAAGVLHTQPHAADEQEAAGRPMPRQPAAGRAVFWQQVGGGEGEQQEEEEAGGDGSGGPGRRLGWLVPRRRRRAQPIPPLSEAESRLQLTERLGPGGPKRRTDAVQRGSGGRSVPVTALPWDHPHNLATRG